MEDAQVFTAVAIAYALCAVSPILYSAVVVLRHRPVLPRRVLFVCLVGVLSYGSVSCASYLLNVPIAAYLRFVAPRLEASGHYSGEPFASAGAELVRYWFFAACFALPLFGIAVTSYLKKRWQLIVEALRG